MALLFGGSRWAKTWGWTKKSVPDSESLEQDNDDYTMRCSSRGCSSGTKLEGDVARLQKEVKTLRQNMMLMLEQDPESK